MRRSQLVCGGLIAAWVAILSWQAVEHARVRQSARAALGNRVRDISTTLGLVMRSQRRFGGIISKERLESALDSLIKPGELNAIALLNDAGEVVASAGTSVDFTARKLPATGEEWADQTITLMNLVDLGTNVTSEAEGARPTIVMDRPNLFPPFGTNRPAPDRPPPPPPGDRLEDRPGGREESLTTTNGPPERGAGPRPRGWSRTRGERGGEGPPFFGRPFWMNEEEYRSLIEKQGVHSVAVVLSALPTRSIVRQDFWLRAMITLLGLVAVGGLWLAWRNLEKSSELEVRLVRASELNTHLKEMNLAAAGLAHETRNPLNIIRGLAQMIGRDPALATEIRERSQGIVEEADRVTAQLNEFINYSRPREIRRTAVALDSVVGEVVRALGFDLEEKAITLTVTGDQPKVEADEPLLRQALFNLVLNAIQAVPRGGQIQIVAARGEAAEASIEVRDTGPGISPEHQADIFKPYFTTHQQGTGLGLAVVQQIVLVHGWEIACEANTPQGAVFRISHLKLAAAA